MSEDEKWMRLALDEAKKGIGRTAPNPPVGAVIVRDKVLLGKGWHHAAGRPHAEREALADVFLHHGQSGAEGATAYVTLEPCSTHGRTPPCTDGLIEAGISRVVYACTDRNPAHVGKADQLLANAGIGVASGVLREECEVILRPFFKTKETGLPWVIWKTAMSLDGRITRPPGEGQWLSGMESRNDVQKLRSTVDAILTSGETVRRDSPALTIRIPELLEGRNQPWRVVATDRPESMPRAAALFSDEWADRTLLRPRHEVAEMLRSLVVEQGVLSVLVEAGGVFSAALFDADLVDEIFVYYAPLICGGGAPALGGGGLPEAIKLDDVKFSRFGNDVRLSALVKRGPSPAH